MDGKVYGYPLWFYGYCNYLNTKDFKEVGLDADKDYPKTWEELGDVAKKLTIKQGDKFIRQGFKFAMHAASWTMIQFNPILIGAGGPWFDADGKCTVNNEAGVKAMTVRASIAKKYGAEDPADSIATDPLPQLDWLKERCAMFFLHPLPPVLVKTENPTMYEQGYYRPVQYPGFEAGEGYATTYGFNLVVNAQARPAKQAVLHDLYKFIMSDPLDAGRIPRRSRSPARAAGRTTRRSRSSPMSTRSSARDNGRSLPRTLVYNELADAMHRAVQKIMLNNADIKATLDEAAAEVDRATAAYKKG